MAQHNQKSEFVSNQLMNWTTEPGDILSLMW